SSLPAPVDASILYVSLDDPFQRYVRQRLEGFRDGLASAGRPVNLYLEFFDQARFGDRPTYAAEFRAWLHQKYRDRHLGEIVVSNQCTPQLSARAPDNPGNDIPPA